MKQKGMRATMNNCVLDKLVSYILKTAEIDYTDKNSVKRYNNTQRKIFEIIRTHYANERILELKFLLGHEAAIVRNKIAVLLLKHIALPRDEVLECIKVQEETIEQLTGDAQKTAKIDLDLWKKGMFPNFANQPFVD